MKLKDIIADTVKRATDGGLSVDSDAFGGVSITFPMSAWYGNPEEDGVYLQPDSAEVAEFEAEYATLLGTDELQDMLMDDLRLFAAARAIDFC